MLESYTVIITMNKNLKGSIAILIATIIWGSTFVAQSMGMDHIGPFTFQAARCFLGGLFLLPVIAVADRFSNNNDGKNFFTRWCSRILWLSAILCSIPLFIAVNLQQVAIVDTDAGKSAFLTAMYIVFVPILGIFRGQKPSKWIPVSVLLGVSGLYFLSCVGVTSIAVSDLLLLGCALAFAVQILIVDMFVQQVDCLRLNCLNCFFCAVMSGIVIVFTETPTWEGIRSGLGTIAYAGIMSMGIAYTLQIIGQKDLKPATASLLMSLESVFAVLSGWLILHEQLTIWEGIGCILLFAAVILSQLPEIEVQKTS